MRRVSSALPVVAPIIVTVFATALALPSCTSPIASRDESSKDQPTTEVGQGVHGWPLYERDVLRDGARTDVLWPVSSVRTLADGTIRRADILFPIGHWSSTGTKTRFGVRPLFDVENEDTAAGHISDWDVLWPIVGWRNGPDESRSHVFPLWWQGKQTDCEYRVGFPIYWQGHQPDKEWFHLWPFYGGFETTRTTPAAWAPARKSAPAKPPAPGSAGGVPVPSAAAAPRGAATDANASTSAMTTTVHSNEYFLWPLVLHETDTSDERSEWDFIPPLFHTGHWNDGDESRAVLWWHRHDGDDEWSLLFPLWFHSKTPASETDVIVPLYARHKTWESDRRFFGGPLYITYDRTDGSESSFDVLWPFFHRGTGTDGQTTRLFPLLWSESRGDSGYFHLWPLYGRDWSPSRTISSTIWPFFMYEDRKDGGWELDVPFPIFHFERGPKHSETRLFPLVMHVSDADGSWSTNVGLLFNTELQADGDHETELFPLFKAAGKPDGSYEGSVGLILSTWDGDGKGQGTFHILWRLVQDDDIVAEEEGVTRTKHLFAVNPLFRSEENDRGDTSWQALFGLVARTQRAGDVQWRFLWFIEP